MIKEIEKISKIIGIKDIEWELKTKFAREKFTILITGKEKVVNEQCSALKERIQMVHDVQGSV